MPTDGRERLHRWHQPWRFVLPRWFTCWRKTRHHERVFVGGGRRWTECYCGLRCFEVKGGAQMELRAAIQRALNELGVPGENYPAPVANAYDILTEALRV